MSKTSNIILDNQNFVPAGLKWLAEMESIQSPALLNIIYGNIYSFPNVKDVEILIDKNNRKMLILIQFNWFTQKVFSKRKKETIINILDQLQELLPSFAFRVIEDRNLFDLAVKRMKESSMGGPNEKQNEKPASISKSNDAATNGDSENADDGGAQFIAAAQAAAQDQSENTQTNSEESSKTKE